MGRTLHYDLTLPTKLTAKQVELMQTLAGIYNKPKFNWTCENCYFTPDTWVYTKSRRDLSGLTPQDLIKYINRNYATGEVYTSSEGDHHPLKHGRGFTKVQGNELNSLMVYTYLLRLSKLLPKGIITLSDEGYFLYGELFIQDGLVYPRLDKCAEGMKIPLPALDDYLTGKIDQLPETDDRYGKIDRSNFLNLLYLFKENTPKDHLLDYHQGAEVDRARWFNPLLMSRRVDIDAFRKYQRDGSTVMAEFHGEGFNLISGEELAARMASYQNSLSKLFKSMGDDVSISVLGEDH